MTITIWTINANNSQRACIRSRASTGLFPSALEWPTIQWLIYKVGFSLAESWYYGSTFNMSHCLHSITWVTQCLRSTIIVLRYGLILPPCHTIAMEKVNSPNRRSRKSFRTSFLALSTFFNSSFIAIYLCIFLLRSGPLQPYIAKARWIWASIHPFLDFSWVFYAGLPEAPWNEDDELDDIV